MRVQNGLRIFSCKRTVTVTLRVKRLSGQHDEISMSVF